MSNEVNEEIVTVYLNHYINLIDELPNVCSRLISQMIECDHECNKLLDKLQSLNHSYKVDVDRNTDAKHYCEKYCEKSEKYLTKLQSLCDRKLILSNTMLNVIKVKDCELSEDYETILLAKRDQPFTYGTRSGRLWHTFRS